MRNMNEVISRELTFIPQNHEVDKRFRRLYQKTRSRNLSVNNSEDCYKSILECMMVSNIEFKEAWAIEINPKIFLPDFAAIIEKAKTKNILVFTLPEDKMASEFLTYKPRFEMITFVHKPRLHNIVEQDVYNLHLYQHTVPGTGYFRFSVETMVPMYEKYDGTWKQHHCVESHSTIQYDCNWSISEEYEKYNKFKFKLNELIEGLEEKHA